LTAAGATVVGVVGDVKEQPDSASAEPAIWWPALQIPWPFAKMSIAIRASSAPSYLTRQLRSTVHRLDGGLAVGDVRVMEQVAGEAYSTPRFALFLVALFAGIALALAAIGMLGARRWDVVRLVVGQGVRMAAVGVIAGLLGGAALAQSLGTLLYEVKRVDALTFVSVAVLGIAVAALACYVPARRATSADPMTALRSD
jgi:hypothetical protein